MCGVGLLGWRRGSVAKGCVPTAMGALWLRWSRPGSCRGQGWVRGGDALLEMCKEKVDMMEVDSGGARC